MNFMEFHGVTFTETDQFHVFGADLHEIHGVSQSSTHPNS